MQRPTRGRRRFNPAQRDKILAAFRRSQLTQKEFAAQAGIGHSTLTQWLRKSGLQPRPGGAGFVPVPNLLPAGGAVGAYRLQFPRGVIVEVGCGFASEELGALLQLVRRL